MKPVNVESKKPNTRLEGVYPAVHKDGTPYFRSSLTYHGKHISLGSFRDAVSAHVAFLEGKHVLSDPLCIPERYPRHCILTFEKWVSLANYRDNGIYFANPIYMGRKMFYYYLSPKKVLKFDLDDLFYFSSHKIMYRGNHYFVADYGMQVSILSRFQIKPYARIGRDYVFLNGDSLDFRRENLEIHNAYHGVTHGTKKGRTVYTVRLHIRSYYVVGHYYDETQAAIAYNKAIDIVRKNGCKKNHTPNYIENISPSLYASIYSEVKISPAIYGLTFQN